MGNVFTPEFIAALSGIIGSVLIALIPQLDSVKVQLIAVITVLITAVVLGLGLERVAAARSSGSTQSERMSAKAESLKVPTVKSL